MTITNEPVIEIRNLTKKFRQVTAINNISLNVGCNEIVGIVGNNGAGKTTLLRLMLDLLTPDKGTILSKSINVFQSDHWKDYTGAYIDEDFLIDFLTSEEFLHFIGKLRKMSSNEIKRNIDEFGILMNGEILNNKKYIRSLSSGNKQKVGIISALLFKPEVVILDEPFNYLDPSSQMILLKIIKDYAVGNNVSLILSSHNLQYISNVCTRVILLEKGHIIYDLRNDINASTLINEYFFKQSNPK
jgi:ABC-2 type transport system ATP-binding protein